MRRNVPKISRRSTGRWIALALALVATTSVARAEVKDVAFKTLVAESDLIVVVEVTKVEPGPEGIRRVDPSFPPVTVATAKVVETWKGAKRAEVRFVASPTWVCDTTNATVGEKRLLILEREGDSPIMRIAHVGRGGMTIREIDGKRYVTIQDEVKMPADTPVLKEEKTGEILYPPSEPGKEPLRFNYPYTVTSAEVSVLKSLVESTVRARGK